MNRLLAALIVACAALATLYGLVHFGARSVPRAIAVNEAPLGCEDEPELAGECGDDDEAPADEFRRPAMLNARADG
ncbi:hypothetical protein J4G53_09225 [Serratia ureilytica]|nr:hypothetical protein [Serratia ureilytica]